jgi:hypothetical protein
LIAAAAASTTDAYERLRSAVLSAEPMPCLDLGTVRRRGLAAWINGLLAAAPTEPARAGPVSTPDTLINPAPAVGELTRIIAGIVIALAAEPAHA